MTEETKIIYYKDTDADKVPYMIKLNIAPEKATLRYFKQALNVNVKYFKFFFQQIVEDFGVVKEEICDDDTKLPFVNGRAVSWLMQVEESLAGSENSRSQNSLNSMVDFLSQ
jgi:segment polarity protein dishevelled